MKHYPFPSIHQFRDIVYEIKLHSTYTGKDEKGEPIYDDLLPKPVIKFKGSTKIHGTNSSIVLLKDGSIQYQSRESILTIHEDNSGFCNYMSKYEEELKRFLKLALMSTIPEWKIIDYEYVAIYGEWCGKGINEGTAIQQLEKMFVIFGCKVDDVWIDFPYELKEKRIFNIQQFASYSIDIDFNDPKASLDELNELALKIEEECPVAKAFGVSGIGEGVVFVGSITKPTFLSETPITTYYRFKVKGKKHSLKVPKIGVDLLTIEMYNTCEDFVKTNLGDVRLSQGISIIESRGKRLHISDIAEFLKWCVNDIKKECDLEIKANNFDEKILNKKCSEIARKYFLNYVNDNL